MCGGLQGFTPGSQGLYDELGVGITAVTKALVYALFGLTCRGHEQFGISMAISGM